MKYLLRSLSIVAIILFFLIGYAWSMQGHSVRDAFDWSVSLDATLPLIPNFLIFYFLGYFYLFAPCFVLDSQKEFHLNYVMMFLIMSVSFLIFKFFPVFMSKELSTGDRFFERLLYFQQTRDTHYNNFPSLHVSLNVFSFLLLYKTGSSFWKWSGIAAFFIVISTLLVKQHLIVDVISGCVLAYMAYKLYCVLFETMNAKAAKIFYIIVMLLLAVVITGGFKGVAPYVKNFINIPWASFN